MTCQAHLAWGVIVVGTMLGAPSARAQDLPAEASERQGQGEALFEAENYDAAIVEFERVYELLDGAPFRYSVLFNIGQCHERLFRYDRALEHYRRYLEEGGPEAEDRGMVEGMIHALEGLLGAVSVTINVPAAEVWVDEHLVGVAPGTFHVPSGTHVVEVRAAGFSPARVETTVAARGEVSVAMTLEALGADHGLHPALFISAAALTLGALGVGIALGAEALAARGDVLGRRQSADDAVAFTVWEADLQNIRDLALLADVMYGVSGALAIGAFLLALFTEWGTAGGAETPTRSVALVPWIGPNVGVAILGRM